MEKQKVFYEFGELQALGLPAGRTLRNHLDAVTGLVDLGGDVPPLRSILIGGSRVVHAAALQDWLAQVGRIGSVPAVAETPATPTPRRRRGRPRKASAGVSA